MEKHLPVAPQLFRYAFKNFRFFLIVKKEFFLFPYQHFLKRNIPPIPLFCFSFHCIIWTIDGDILSDSNIAR